MGGIPQTPPPRQSPVTAPDPRRSHGPKGDEEGHDQRCHRFSGRREDGVEGEAGAGGVRRVEGGHLRGGREDGEVHHPAAGDAEVEAKPARKAGTKMMFGKEVRVAAKPASKVVKAFPAKSLKDSI